MKEKNCNQKPFRDMGSEVLCVCQAKVVFGVIGQGLLSVKSWMLGCIQDEDIFKEQV